ncbi:MAG: CHASE domain-containing protein [Rhodospirillaceae bacterium]|nr:CHASE domain-containing protein [Rhodospirillales bacterium]
MLVALSLVLAWWLGNDWYAAYSQEKNVLKAERQLSLQAQEIMAVLNKRLGLLDGMESFIKSEIIATRKPVEGNAELASFMTGLLSTAPGIRGLSVAPKGIITAVQPLAGNEPALGLNLRTDQRASGAEAMGEAIRTRKIVVSDPFELLQGGLGLVARKAVFEDGKFWGVVSIILDMQPFLEESGLRHSGKAGMAQIAMRDRAGNVFFGAPEVFQSQPALRRLHMISGDWEIGAVPLGGWAMVMHGDLVFFRSITAALCLLVLGAFLSHRQLLPRADAGGPAPKITAALALPVVLVLTMSLTGVALVWLSQERDLADERERLSNDLDRAIEVIDHSLDGDRVFLEHLADEIARGTVDANDFQSKAALYVTAHPGLINVTWSDDAFVIRNTAPLEPNRQVLGLKLTLSEPERTSRLARDTHASAYTKPFTVLQGVPAFELYVPIYRDSRFLGNLGGVYSLPEMLRHTLPDWVHERYGLTVRSESGAVLVENYKLGRDVDSRITGSRNLPLLAENATIGFSRYTPSGDWRVTLLAILSVSLTLGMAYTIAAQQREISVRRRVEGELTRTVAELTRTNVELERFAYVAAHDLQEPIRSVVSFSQLLERRHGPHLAEEAREYIGFVVSGAKRLSTLIAALLDYSRAGHSHTNAQETDCNAVVSGVLEYLRATIDQTRAEVTVAPLPTVVGDSCQLHQLFQNLIGNGLKYCRPTAPPSITVKAERSHDGWVFEVSDNGIGIDKEYHSHIFEPFRRLHSATAYPGTGIGLSLCKRIVENHGGKIWVEAWPDTGSRFHFTLPDRPANAAAAA